MRIHMLLLALAGVGLFGCTDDSSPAPTEVPIATPESPDYEENVTELPVLKIGEYEVHANYEGPLAAGHFNFHVTGPEFAAIRQWVGPEDAQGVFVGRAEVLSDHIHAGVEMPNPMPPDPRLWIEIETQHGEKLKGSLLLQ